MSQFPLNPGQLTLADLRAWYFEPQQLELAESAIEDIERSAATVQKVLDKGRVVYGINTGFGLLANNHFRLGRQWIAIHRIYKDRTGC